MSKLLPAVRRGAALLLVALALGLAPTPGEAQGQAAPPAAGQQQPQQPAGPKTIKIGPGNDQNPQPWLVNCQSQQQSNNLSCTMSQVLLAQGSNQRVLGATVFRPQANGPAILRLALPHGILLQKGVDVWIDLAAPQNYPIIIADQNGSYANVELSGNMIVSLQGGAFLNVGVTAANNDRVEFQLSLKGFTNAFGKL